MKRFAGAIVILGVGALLFSCASDIILEPPPSLAGEYAGRYIIRTISGSGGSGSNEVKNEQRILWRFTDQVYDMDVDFDHPNYNGNFCICEPFGRYLLEDRVRLNQDGSLPPGDPLCTACDDRVSPSGLFELDRSTDTLKLIQQETSGNETIIKEIRLLRVVEETE